MRAVFMGTPVLAAKVLSGLYEAGYTLPLVVTRPDKPRGRGRKVSGSPVKAFALEKELPVFQPENWKDAETVERIRETRADVIVVAAYGRILPPAVLAAAPLGCLNVHASLLPAWRGAAPIQWTLLTGEEETGITIMQMEEGMDTGPILMQEKLPVREDMDYGGLYDALGDLGTALLLKALPLWAAHELKPRPQPAEGVSYAMPLERKHEIIDWRRPAEEIRNQVRALCPAPGALTHIGDKEIKVLGVRMLRGDEEARISGQTAGTAAGQTAGQTAGGPQEKAAEMPERVLPGQLVGILRREGPVVATGAGRLLLTLLQPAGKKPMDGPAWLAGSRMEPGQIFGRR